MQQQIILNAWHKLMGYFKSSNWAVFFFSKKCESIFFRPKMKVMKEQNFCRFRVAAYFTLCITVYCTDRNINGKDVNVKLIGQIDIFLHLKYENNRFSGMVKVEEFL